MDCLFIHGNYPAQFRHLAPLIANAGHRVVFLTNRPDANVLLDEGFHPRFVVTHAGNGLGLFIKDLLPKTFHIGYFEWYFKPNTTQHLTAEFNLDTRLKSSWRNLPILQELECCDIAVIPTEWQKQQFPEAYQSKLNVIFDGIDCQFFHQRSESLSEERHSLNLRNRETNEKFAVPSGAKVISYATRGMETLRGFPEFMRALPELLETNPNLYAVITGADRRAYSYDAPTHNGSWKQRILAELKGQLPARRVLFTGLLDYNDYRALLWRSDLHCYFTRPYVTSWSLFEAAACGAHLAVNVGPATSGIACESSLTWVDLEDQQKLTQQLGHALSHPTPRAQLLQGFDLETSLQKWEKLLNQAIQSS